MSDYPPGRGFLKERRTCADCWINCEQRRSTGGYLLPCNADMRRFVREHGNDKGDERGFVWQ